MACIAVGHFTSRAGAGVTLAERWNGTRWAIQPTSNPPRANGRVVSYLGSVSCASTRACVAVGYSGNSLGTTGVTLAEHWNGTSWAIERTPHPADATVGFLSGVSCGSPRSCTVVGFFTGINGGDAMLVERWDGTSWTIQPTPNPVGASSNSLEGVSCTSTTACTAVGGFVNRAGTAITLAERYS